MLVVGLLEGGRGEREEEKGKGEKNGKEKGKGEKRRRKEKRRRGGRGSFQTHPQFVPSSVVATVACIDGMWLQLVAQLVALALVKWLVRGWPARHVRWLHNSFIIEGLTFKCDFGLDSLSSTESYLVHQVNQSGCMVYKYSTAMKHIFVVFLSL